MSFRSNAGEHDCNFFSPFVYFDPSLIVVEADQQVNVAVDAFFSAGDPPPLYGCPQP